MPQIFSYQNKIIKNCDTRTTAMSAIGYVAAYAAATSSVFATPISVPSAGVLVIPPVIAPRLLSRLSFKTYFANRKPITIGMIVIMTPYTKYIGSKFATKSLPPGTPAPTRNKTSPSSRNSFSVCVVLQKSFCDWRFYIWMHSKRRKMRSALWILRI